MDPMAEEMGSEETQRKGDSTGRNADRRPRRKKEEIKVEEKEIETRKKPKTVAEESESGDNVRRTNWHLYDRPTQEGSRSSPRGGRDYRVETVNYPADGCQSAWCNTAVLPALGGRGSVFTFDGSSGG